MEVVFSLRGTRCLQLVLFLAVITAPAQDFCSLTVRVANPDGYKPTGVPVILVESNGRVEPGTTKNGEVKFCDLGLSPVTVTVGGSDRCGELAVRNVAVNWGTERVLKVIYDHAYCNGDEIQNAGCLDLLRFVDELARPVAGVHLEAATGVAHEVQSDGYGRAMVKLQSGETAVLNARSPGHKPETVELTCSGTSKREVMVSLHRESREPQE
jgi:hypothetical protein